MKNIRSIYLNLKKKKSHFRWDRSGREEKRDKEGQGKEIIRPI